MKKILILGISSFSGSAFADFMLTKNFSVVGTYRRRKNNLYQPHLQNKNIKNFQSFKIDININLKKLLKIIKKYKPQYIIDFASICMVNESWTKPELYLKSNSLRNCSQYSSSPVSGHNFFIINVNIFIHTFSKTLYIYLCLG